MDPHNRVLSEATEDVVARVRRAVQHLPGVELAIDGFGHRSFRVNKKTMVMVGQDAEGHPSLSIKSDPATQQHLIKTGRYVRTPYIGQHGWVSTEKDTAIDWNEIVELIEDAYRLVAPKKLLAQLDEN